MSVADVPEAESNQRRRELVNENLSEEAKRIVREQCRFVFDGPARMNNLSGKMVAVNTCHISYVKQAVDILESTTTELLTAKARIETLTKALEEIGESLCGCASNTDPNWHSAKCLPRKARAALGKETL